MEITNYIESKKPILIQSHLNRFITIPPLNADIRFANFLPKYQLPFVQILFKENFSWGIISNEDNELIVKKKKLIKPVFDQHNCGCCFAIGVVDALSDNFVVSGLVNYQPNISTTYALSCYSGNKCNGGTSALLALDIAHKGIPDISCIDYSWCINNLACNGKNFTTSDDLSKKIPNCGCYFPIKKFIYKFNEVAAASIDDADINDADKINEFKNKIKTHILYFGPVIGGYVVLKNFVSGIFTKTNGGVYLDRADYSNTELSFSDSNSLIDDDNALGLHVINIMGWGIAKNIQYDNNIYGDVPYWHCRNSWGTKWGDNGYFKIAMYPFNKMSQVDKIKDVFFDNKNSRLGGIILLKTLIPPSIQKFDQINQTYFDEIKRQYSNEFYKKEPQSENNNIIFGPTGPRGEIGPRGPQGIGLRGLQGPRGRQGRQGIGLRGLQGEIGPRGRQGIGLRGLQGEIGPRGPRGIGLRGLQGEIGPRGPRGIGLRGLQGEIGPRGPQGMIGPMGPRGFIRFKSNKLLIVIIFIIIIILLLIYYENIK